MPDEHLTIIDQIDIAPDRTIQVRVGLLTLTDGEPDEQQTKRVRFGFQPGDDPSQIFSATSSYLQNERGRDPLSQDHQDYVFKVGQAAHDAGAIANHQEYMAVLVSGKRNPNGTIATPDPTAYRRLDLAMRLGRLGANVRAVAGAPYQEANFVESMTITRTRRFHVRIASAHIQGGRELARIESVGKLPPGSTAAELAKQVNAGLTQRGRLTIGAGALALVARGVGVAHTPEVVTAYQAAYAARVMALTERGLDPTRHRIELSQADAVRVARAYTRAPT